MQIPVPTNRLVSLTIAGAVLTSVVALALAAPGLGVDSLTDSENPTVASDAPTPNEDFTPAVQSGSGEHEDDEYEEHEEYEDEEDEEYEEHDEYEDD